MSGAIVIHDATLIDGSGGDPRRRVTVAVENGLISRIGTTGSTPEGARTIDAAGRTLMPGLTDAHVHFGLTEAGANEPPQSHVSYVLKVVENIRIALDEGFTTVRDAGGLDPAYAEAVATGQITGPTILPSGSFLSITGGHGDQRSRWRDEEEHSIAGLVAHTELCDGVDEVRKAARKQIRRGATQVKLMASGGVMSPNDPIDSLQFSVEEMSAAVQEARAFGKYVMAHCHTPGAMSNALDAGVRSLEHGSIMSEDVAVRIARESAYLVPTLAILEILARASNVPEFSRQKLESVRERIAPGMELVRAAGVAVGSGSDLLGPRQRRRASELVEKAKHFGAMEAIVSATKTNAALFCMADRIGTVEEGKDADLLLVDGDPLEDIGVLVQPERLQLVLKAGEPVRDLIGAG